MPSTPTLTVVPNTADGRNVVSISNSDVPDYNDIYRSTSSENNGQEVRIAYQAAINSTFYDSNVAAGITYNYRVEAVDGGVAASSTVATATLSLDNLWIHAVRKSPNSNVFGTAVALINMATQERDLGRESSQYTLSGRTVPKVLTSEIQGETLSVLCRIPTADYADKETLLSIQESSRYVCVRDQNSGGILGFKIFGTLDIVPLQYQFGFTDFQLTITAVHYSEQMNVAVAADVAVPGQWDFSAAANSGQILTAGF